MADVEVKSAEEANSVSKKPKYNFPSKSDFEKVEVKEGDEVRRFDFPEHYHKITEIMEENLDDFLKYNGLTVEGSGSYEWNHRDQCYDFTIKIAGKLSKDHANPGLEGRTIRIKFEDKPGKLETGTEGHIIRCRQLAESAKKLLREQRVRSLEDLNLTPEKKKKLKLTKEDEQTIESNLLNSDEKLDQYAAELDFSVSYLSKMLTALSVDLSSNERERILANAIVQKEYERIYEMIKNMEKNMLLKEGSGKIWKKAIDLEAELVADTVNREVVVAVFPNKDESGNIRSMQYEWCTPLTDLPSPLRNGMGGRLPNAWKVKNAVFDLQEVDGGELAFNLREEATQYRSTSFPAIKDGDEDSRKLKTKNIAENYLKGLATDQLVRCIIDSRDEHGQLTLDLKKLKEAMQVRVAVTSLLSPFGDLKYGFNLFGLQLGTPGIILFSLTGVGGLVLAVIYIIERLGNKDRDTRQVNETEEVFDSIEKLDLKGQVDDIIAKAGITDEKQKAEIRSFLNNQENTIDHVIIYQNFATNEGRGHDQTGTESRLIDFARRNFAGIALEKYQGVLTERSRLILASINDGTINWEKGGREEFERVLTILHGLFVEEPERYRDVYKCMSLFFRYMEYTYNPYPGGRFSKDPRHNFIPAVIVDELSTSLGLIPHNQCKSGEDRTGTKHTLYNIMKGSSFGATAEVPLHMVMSSDKNFDDLLDNTWDQFERGAMLSNSRRITKDNAPGAEGLQIDSSNVPKKIGKFIKKNKKDAQKHKDVFKKYKPLKKEKQINRYVQGVLINVEVFFLKDALKEHNEGRPLNRRHVDAFNALSAEDRAKAFVESEFFVQNDIAAFLMQLNELQLSGKKFVQMDMHEEIVRSIPRFILKRCLIDYIHKPKDNKTEPGDIQAFNQLSVEEIMAVFEDVAMFHYNTPQISKAAWLFAKILKCEGVDEEKVKAILDSEPAIQASYDKLTEEAQRRLATLRAEFDLAHPPISPEGLQQGGEGYRPRSQSAPVPPVSHPDPGDPKPPGLDTSPHARRRLTL